MSWTLFWQIVILMIIFGGFVVALFGKGEKKDDEKK
jgi:hypothetical protein